MKPLKGMNQDVSSANMPEGTYRRAQNFIYGKELDSLMQEPGLKKLAGSGDTGIAGGRALCGAHALPGDDFLLFVYTSTSPAGQGSAIYRYTASTGLTTLVLEDNDLNFSDTTVLKVAHFQNAAAELQVVFTDGENPLRILNLSDVDSDMTTNKLFPEFNQVDLNIEVGAGNGGFPVGTHFFCVAYEQEDGSRTGWQGLFGPFPVKEEAGTFEVEMSNIDTDYPYILIASLTFTGNALEAKIQRRFPAGNSTLTRLVDNINPYGEVTVAELTAKPQVYTSAKTLTFHENRLYLGNVTEHDEEDLQQYANWIEPIWAYGPTGNGSTRLGREMDETQYPAGLRFMPGEVYAFYVAWVRSDGSETRAFHIPGRPVPGTINLEIEAADSHLFGANTTVTVDPTATLATNMSAYADGRLNYLKFDEEAGNTHYYMARDTCEVNGNYNVGDGARPRGRMGIWENQNETYPSDFPAQKRFSYNGGGGGFISITQTTLAGEKVRHHKMPTEAWLDRETGVNLSSLSNRPTLAVEFEHVPMPEGYVGVRFYHAKRTINNSTVLGQSLLFHGAHNHYSLEAIGENLTDHVATNGINTINNNSTPSGTNPVTGRTLANDDALATTTAFNQMILDYGRMHPFDMMRAKPRVSPAEGRYYIRFDHIIGKQAEPYTAFDGVAGANSEWQHFIVDTDSNFDIWELWEGGNFESEQIRNRLMYFDYMKSAATFHIPSEIMRLRSVSDVHYLSPGIIDSERQIDNRGGEECLHFKIDQSITGVDMHFPNNAAGYDYYQAKFINNWTGESRSAKSGFWLDNIYSVNTASQSSANETPVSVAPIASFCVARQDVYQGYASQELIACTPVMGTLDEPQYDNAQQLNAGEIADLIAATDSNVTEVGKVRFFHVNGDMAVSEMRYRTTAWAGWTHHHSADPLNDSRNITDKYSPDPTAGTIRIGHNIAMYTVANPYYIDTDQSKLGLFDYLGSNDRPVTPDQTNDFTVDVTFLKSNDFRQPGIYDSTESYTNTYPYRVHRSQAQANDEPDINIRTFLAFDSYEMPRSRGSIQNLQSYIDKLLIHHEQSLYVTRGKEKFATTAGEIAFGTGDIFSTVPVEVIPTPNGYGGTQHMLSCILTPAGYFYVDASMGKVFQYAGGKLQEISAFGMRDYFFNKLTNLNQTTLNTEAVFGYHPGVLSVYDSRWNRVIFHIRDNTWDVSSLPNFSYDASQNQDPAYYQSGTKAKDVWLSYNLDLNNWTSFHTYNWVGAVGTQNELYSFNRRQIADTTELVGFRHNDLQEPFTRFIGGGPDAIKYDSYIDAVLSYPQGVVFSSVQWYTKAFDHDEDTLGFVDHDRTFTHATIYNDYQCSGETQLVRAVQDRLLDHTANLRRDDTMWKWNDFRDLVDDRTLRFVDEEGDVINTNIDDDKSWFDQRRIAGNHATVRLRYDNTTDSTIGLYLYDIDAKVRKAYR